MQLVLEIPVESVWAENWGLNFLEINFSNMLKAVKKRYTKVKKKDDQDNDANGTTDEGMYIVLKRLKLGLNTLSCMRLRPIFSYKFNPRVNQAQEFSRGVVEDHSSTVQTDIPGLSRNNF